MRNQEIRETAKQKGVRLWMVAEKLGITDATFSRKLRKPFSTEERTRVLAIIDELAQEETA